MNKTKEKRLRHLLEYMNKRSQEISANKNEFDNLIEEKYGYHYSDKDLDWIIDNVDYGLGKVSFEEFDKIMLENKNK